MSIGFHRGRRGQKTPRVGVLRRLEECCARSSLDDSPMLHNRNLVRGLATNLSYDSEIMRDEEHCQILLSAYVGHQT